MAERLSSPAGPGESAAKRHLAHFGQKNASGSSGFNAIHEIDQYAIMN